MRIASYNVNGVNGRLSVLLRWLEEARPDIVCLQELKCPDERFPRVALEAAGYGAVTGQRLYQLIRQKAGSRERLFSIEFLDPGAEAYAFTFG